MFLRVGGTMLGECLHLREQQSCYSVQSTHTSQSTDAVYHFAKYHISNGFFCKWMQVTPSPFMASYIGGYTVVAAMGRPVFSEILSA